MYVPVHLYIHDWSWLDPHQRPGRPAMAAMLELPPEARRAWASMPCGDVRSSETGGWELPLDEAGKYQKCGNGSGCLAIRMLDGDDE